MLFRDIESFGALTFLTITFITIMQKCPFGGVGVVLGPFGRVWGWVALGGPNNAKRYAWRVCRRSRRSASIYIYAEVTFRVTARHVIIRVVGPQGEPF